MIEGGDQAMMMNVMKPRGMDDGDDGRLRGVEAWMII